MVNYSNPNKSTLIFDAFCNLIIYSKANTHIKNESNSH